MALPALLSLLPAIAEIGTGIAGMVSAGKQRREGRALFDKSMREHAKVPLNDPEQMRLLSGIQQRQLAMEAGTSKMMGTRIRQAQSALAQTQANAARGAGGSAGTLMDVLTRAQRQTGEIINEGAAQEQQQALGLLGMQGGLVTDMAQRRLAHQKYLRDLYAARGAGMMQDAAVNQTGALGALLSGGIGAASQLDIGRKRIKPDVERMSARDISFPYQPPEPGIPLSYPE